VGVDRYSNYPESVRRLPQVGGGIDPDIEAIVALRPDLVLLATSSRAATRLQGLGIAVAALEPRTHADVHRVLKQVALLLDVPDPERVWREIEAAIDTAAQSLPASRKPTRVYFEVNSGPYAASESSFIGETLRRLGVQNIVPASLGVFPRLNPEFVVRADPDVIMVGDSRAAEMVRRPGWSNLRAIRAQRVCAFTQAQSDVLVRAGPRMAEGARLMAQCLMEKVPGP
jgi:iron complex transport system substrate-binding protein